MHARSIALALAIVLAGVDPPLVSAQEADLPVGDTTESDRARARDLATAGVTAFEEHDYERALALFREAFAIAPVAELRFNVAMCLERLARFREAALEYDGAAASAALSEAQRRDARERGDRARARLGTLALIGPSGATGTVDGLSCTIPCEVRVDARAHRVRASIGARSGSVDIALGRGERREVEISVEDERARSVVSPRAPPTPSGDRWPSWLSGVGGGLALVGAGGIIGFGLRTEELARAYDHAPSAAIADEGELVRGLANGSIAVAGAGVALIVIDVILGATTPSEASTVEPDAEP